MRYSLLIFATIFIVSCTSYNYDNPYYGYNNNKDIIEDESDYAEDGWVNPMSNNKNQENQNVNSNNNQSSGSNYVPVIVPWWNGYYGWGNSTRSRYAYYGYCTNYWGPEWYSPWYHYHPYYGVTWDDYYYHKHNSRYWNPRSNSYTDRSIKNSNPRTFGNSRGTYSVYNPRNSNNRIVNDREYNPRSTRYTVDGDNIFKRGGNYQVKYGNRRNDSQSGTNTIYSQPNSNTNQRGSSNVSSPSKQQNSNSSGGNSRGGSSGGGRSGNSRGR